MIDELIEHVRDVYRRGFVAERNRDALTLVLRILRGLPRPVTHDRKLGIDTRKQDWQYWLNKIREETREADVARDKWERARELMDIITVCVSCLASMGFDWLGRAKLGEETNEKNDERGCFK